MRAETLLKTFALASCIATLAGCETPATPGTFNQAEVGRKQTVEMGTVYALRGVTIQNDSRGVARITGALLGGIAGSAVGGGSRVPAAGAVGNAAAAGNRPGVEIIVDLDSGLTVAIAQEGSVDEFRVGDRVRVSSSGGTTRVSR